MALFKHILISVNSFIGVLNSIWVLHNTCTSLLTESQAFLQSINSWFTVPVYSRLRSCATARLVTQ
jgi:hypothetical protein